MLSKFQTGTVNLSNPIRKESGGGSGILDLYKQKLDPLNHKMGLENPMDTFAVLMPIGFKTYIRDLWLHLEFSQ